ncbi:hypothetical protein AB0F43_18055 [Kribbella sp. NPDC023972]|uniref:hypothetical protein n=1 Tax=Kribbella sp. NPDC023972 TaxID=3154795 RepID=UPI0033CF7112
MTRYFRRRWNETRGDDHDDWGTSEWCFEVDDDGWVSRQIEVYDSGPTLRYDRAHVADEFGGLSEAPLPLDEFAPHEIPRDAFELAWRG